MTTFSVLLKRNIKLFFKDKGMFFTSLITPAILLVLYISFLADVYKDALNQMILQFNVTNVDAIVSGAVGGQLMSSLLAVCSVTVPFCSNMLMVSDKVSGAASDFAVSPVKRSTLSLSYYVSTFVTSLSICFVAMFLGLAYIAFVGWYLTFSDVLLIALDVVLVVMFGTALSSIINFFMSTQGQISAVGTIVSSGYGFICGAYMPISQFSPALQKVISFIPGTYGTSLLRNHCMNTAFEKLSEKGVPLNELRQSFDCSLDFFGKSVPISAMYAVLCITVALLIFVYIIINKKRS